MSALENKVFGEIIEVIGKNEKLISNIILWDNNNNYEEQFSIFHQEKEALILSSNGDLKFNRRYLIDEKIIEKNNIKYLKIFSEYKFENLTWEKVLPKYMLDIQEGLLKNKEALDFYKENTLNYFNESILNRHFIFRFSRNGKMVNIVLKNNSIYVLVKLDEINKKLFGKYHYY